MRNQAIAPKSGSQQTAWRAVVVYIGCLSFLTLANTVVAQANLWNSFSGTNNWSTAGNWTNNLVPANGGSAGATLQFTNDVAGGDYGATNDFSTKPFVVTQMIFSNANVGGGVISLSGGQLKLTNNTGNTIPAMIIQNGGGAVMINNDILLAANLAVAGTGGGALTLNGIISGGSNLTMGSSGTLILNNVNTFSGATSVTNGTLRAGIANIFTNTTLNVALVNNVSTGRFDTAGFNQQIRSLTGNGIITNSTATMATITVNSNNAAFTSTFGGTISGSNALTKSGSSTLVLTNKNTYFGVTTINGGTLQVGVSGGPTSTFIPGGLNVVSGNYDFLVNQTVASLSGGASGNVVGHNTLLTFGSDNSDTTFSGTFAGVNTFTKTGSGTTTLFSASSTGGPISSSVNVSGGGIKLGVGGYLSSSFSALTLNGSTGSSFDLNGFNQGLTGITFDSNVAGKNYAVTTGNGTATVSFITMNNQTGSGTATGMITGNIVFTGTPFLYDVRNANGVNGLVIINGSIKGNVAMTTGGNSAGTIRLDGSTANTENGVLTVLNDAMQLNKSNGVNAVAGDVVLDASGSGNFTLLQGNQIADTANVYAYHNGFVLNGQNETIASLALAFSSAGTMSYSSTLTLGGTGTALAITSSVSDAVILDGNVALTGASGGNVVLTSTGSGGNTIQIGNATVGLRTFDLGSVTRTFTVADNANAGISVEGTITSQITGSGGLIKAGTGVLQLQAVNTFTGDTKVTAGGLKLASNLALQNSAFDTSGGGSLDLTAVNIPVVGGLKSASNFALANNVTALTLNVRPDVTNVFSGILSGTGRLTKTNSGEQVFSGANTYSGGTTISNGVLMIQNNSALGFGIVTNIAGAALQMSNGITVTNTIRFLAGTGIANDGALRNMSNNNIYSGFITLGAGARINSDANLLTVSGNITNGGFDLTVGGVSTTAVSGVIAGTGGLVKDGASPLIVIGASTYSGATTISNGYILAANSSAFGSGLLTNIAGTALQLSNAVSIANTLRFLSGTGVANDGALRNVSGNNTYGGNITLGSAARINSDVNQLTVSGNITNGGFGLTVGGVSTTIVSGVIAGAGGLVKDGAGTLSFSTASTYTGGTTISNGTVKLTGGNDRLSLVGAITAVGGTFDLGGNGQTTSGQISFQGGTVQNGILTNNTTAFDGQSGLVSATVAGSAGLTKSTGGILTLTAANTYGGGTIINAGTLLANNTAGSGTGTGGVQINANGTLGGTGIVAGAVNVASGGSFTPTSGGLFTLQSSITNRGFVTVNSARLVVSGLFTNAGSVSFQHSVGTFNSAVVNSGAWITDPSTNVFNSDYTVTSAGSISAASGDVFIFRSNLVNQSTQSTTWNTLNVTPGSGSVSNGTKFLFSGTSINQTQTFFDVGLALTGGFMGAPSPLVSGIQTVSTVSAAAGFANNFALGELELTNTTLMLAQSFPSTTTNALFVNDLFLDLNSQLIISNNMRVYFVNSNGWTLSNVTLLGNAEIHQLATLIPEPSVLVLWISALATVYAARRRRH